MKKNGISFIALIIVLLAFPLHGYGENIDVIVMVDITWSLQQSFPDIEKYLLGTLLDDVLHDGDTFHLLWFSDHPETMITAVVAGPDTRADIKARIAGLVNLQWPLGKYTDLVSAVDYLINFSAEKTSGKEKLVILITDGIHDPPPGKNVPKDFEELKKTFLKQAEEIKKQGWSIHILKTPLADGAKEAQASVFFKSLEEGANAKVTPYAEGKKEALLTDATGFAQILYPPDIGEVGRQFVIPFTVQNAGENALSLTLTGIEFDGKNILEWPAVVTVPAGKTAPLAAQVLLPENLPEGRQDVRLRLQFAEDIRVLGETGSLTLTFNFEAPPQTLFVLPAWVVILGILAIIIIFLLFILLVHLFRTRGFHFSLRRTLGADRLAAGAERHGPRKRHLEENSHHSFAVEMIVAFQKRHIGQRNIRRIPLGKSLSVGGGKSAFLIFLVPVPPRIGEIGFDGSAFSFSPVKREFFPELKGVIADCLDKPINAVSKKGYPLEIRFHRYVSPLEEINMIFEKIREKM